MWNKWPTKRIFIGKTDLDIAYLRVHANITTASTCIAIVDKLAFLYLRLPFGTTPTPSESTDAIEAAIDLGDDLLRKKSWDTENTNSPHRYSLPKEDKQQLENYHAKVDSLAVEIKAT